MQIKHFAMSGRRVPDPMRPGRTAVVGVLRSSGNTSLSHQGKTYEPASDGWFEVPHEVGVELCRYRASGSGFYTRAEVDEETRLGNVEADEAPRRGPGRPRKSEADI